MKEEDREALKLIAKADKIIYGSIRSSRKDGTPNNINVQNEGRDKEQGKSQSGNNF